MSENKQFTSESVIYSSDIMEKIFSYLNVRDLRRAAGVCWHWHETAKKQLPLRNTIESLLLPLWITPFNDGYCFLELDGFFESYDTLRYAKKAEKPDLTDAKWHVSDVVRCVPKIFLVFCGDHTYMERPFDGTELYGDTNVGAGISIPWSSHLQCETLDIDEYFKNDYADDYDEEFASYLIDEALSKLEMSTTATNDEYSCFILFLNRTLIEDRQYYFSADRKFERYVTELLNRLAKRFKSGTYALLGTGCYWNTNSLLKNPWLDSDYTYLMRIHGSALKSWSIVIDLKLLPAERERKLLDFKKKVQVNSSTFALCSYPVKRRFWRCTDDNDADEFSDFVPTEIFKRVFPTVTLTCFYDDQDFGQFGCNTLDIDGELAIKHEKSLIYLLITTK